MEIQRESRFLLTELIESSDGSLYWGVWEPVVFEQRDDELFHRVARNEIGRLDLIADQYYGNVNYWWVIATVNDILNPVEDMHAGDTLRIPSREYIELVMENARAKVTN